MRRGRSWPGPLTKRRRGPKANEPTRHTRADAPWERDGMATLPVSRKRAGWHHLGYGQPGKDYKALYERIVMFTVGRGK